ncbi:MAG: hypothetical protein COA67_12225 [Lutibacter sp.]|nr:MAG: hypothetical protein COA67_12225 [Lutibacter sp.]
MKHLLLSFFMLTILVNTKIAAQNDKQDHIKSLKIGFITQKLELTSKEAQNFWPVYNEHQNKIRSQHEESRKLRRSIHKNGGIDAMTNAEAERILNQFVAIEKNLKDAEMAMYKSMKSILPAKKILKLHSAEKGFSRKILEEMRKRRGNFKGQRQN